MGREVVDLVDVVLFEDAGDECEIGDIFAVEGKALLVFELLESPLLQSGVVVVVDVVDSDNLVTLVEEVMGYVGADEAGRAGDELGSDG